MIETAHGAGPDLKDGSLKRPPGGVGEGRARCKRAARGRRREEAKAGTGLLESFAARRTESFMVRAREAEGALGPWPDAPKAAALGRSFQVNSGMAPGAGGGLLLTPGEHGGGGDARDPDGAAADASS